jgi:hypothetical protein
MNDENRWKVARGYTRPTISDGVLGAHACGATPCLRSLRVLRVKQFAFIRVIRVKHPKIPNPAQGWPKLPKATQAPPPGRGAAPFGPIKPNQGGRVRF